MSAWADARWAQQISANETAREEKKARKAANREAWRRSHINSNCQTEEILAAVIPEVPEPAADTNPLDKLRAIMLDPTVHLYRRLDAAEVVLAYELGPASLAGVLAENVAAGSYLFMKGIVDAPGVPERLQFRALKALSAIENCRAVARQSAGEQVAKRELARRLGKDAEWAAGSWSWPPHDVARRLDAARAKHRLSQQR